MIKIAAMIAISGMAFQIGHFGEHAFQFIVWCLGDLSQICGRDTPWASWWVKDGIAAVGGYVVPGAPPARLAMIGLEVLHLIGNTIFLTALIALYLWMPSSWVKWACFIEGFHLYEHIMLTTTAIYLGKPIGLSTLFGAVGGMEKEAAVGIRVSWHFVMNLFPMPLAMIGMMETMGWPKGSPATSVAMVR